MGSLKTGFGHFTAAQHVVRGQSLAGKKIIVTGAASGIGVETTRALAGAGADVTLAVRSTEAGEKVAAELRGALPKEAGKLTVMKLDLADLTSVRSFADAYRSLGDRIDVLLNNAGVMATPKGFTKQNFELQLGTNHLGHFLLTKLLGDLLADDGRVVNLSSDAHKSGRRERLLATLDSDPRYEKRAYSPWGAYGDSKLANLLFTLSLSKRLKPNQLTFAIHPGVIPTNLFKNLGFIYPLARYVGSYFMKDVRQGAATSVFGAAYPGLTKEHSGSYLKDGNLKTPSRLARDEALAEEVWGLSEKLVA